METMTKIRLIASDLDGTLLKDGAQSLRPDTCSLIERLLDRGIRFAAASGRQPDNLFRLFAPVKDRIDYVCQNGASAVVCGKRILYEPMDAQAAAELASEIRSVPGLELFVSDYACSYVETGHDDFLRLVRDTVKINTEEAMIFFPKRKGVRRSPSMKKSAFIAWNTGRDATGIVLRS